MWSSENHAFDGSSCYLIGAKGDNNPFLGGSRGAEGPKFFSLGQNLLHHWQWKMKSSLFYAFSFLNIQDYLTKFHICKTTLPIDTQKSCQISPEGDTSQIEIKMVENYAWDQRKFYRGKKTELLSRWNEYLVICIYYENHNLTIQFTTVCFWRYLKNPF